VALDLGALSTLPFRKTVVVGAGYIALELAGILAHLGSHTEMLIRHKRVLRSFDHTISNAITDHYDKGPVHLRKETGVSK
jgi:glutathione reductase (NADPH)